MNELLKKRKDSADPDTADKLSAACHGAVSNSMLSDIMSGTAAPTSAMLGTRESLAPSLQTKMQGAFGVDFSNVEIYRSQTARDAGFNGIASGNKVALAPDIDLNSHAGQMVLGHELSHVVAQAQGIGGGRGFLGNSSLERQADIQGERAASGMRAAAGSGLSMETSLDFSSPTMTAGGMESTALTPISATAGAFGMGAPMQGDKDKSYDPKQDSWDLEARNSAMKPAENAIKSSATDYADDWNAPGGKIREYDFGVVSGGNLNDMPESVDGSPEDADFSAIYSGIRDTGKATYVRGKLAAGAQKEQAERDWGTAGLSEAVGESSSEYARLMESLDGLNQIYAQASGTKLADIKTGSSDAGAKLAAAYPQAIEQCVLYLQKFGGEEKGQKYPSIAKVRASYVTQLLARIQRDWAGLMKIDDVLASQEAPNLNLKQALGDIRSVKMAYRRRSPLVNPCAAAENAPAVDVGAHSLNKTVGGAMSTNYVIKNDSQLSFFRMDQYDTGESIGRQAKKHVARDRVTKMKDVRDEHWEGFRQAFEGEAAKKVLQNRLTLSGLRYSDEMVKKGNFDMNDRNVATSRVADLLGVGNLVARSRKAYVTDEATGVKYRGNLMAGAAGKEFSKIRSVASGESASGGMDVSKTAQSTLAPSAMRELANLQVLDVICGQADRHTGNVFGQTDEKGVVQHVTGIDNDLSFGMNKDTYGIGEWRYDNRVYDPSGNMVIPYMDKAMADRIMNLSREQFELEFADLRLDNENAAVGAAWDRLCAVRGAIEKQRAAENRSGGKSRFLEGNEAWTPEVLEKFLDARKHREKFMPVASWGRGEFYALTQASKQRAAQNPDEKLFAMPEEFSNENIIARMSEEIAYQHMAMPYNQAEVEKWLESYKKQT